MQKVSKRKGDRRRKLRKEHRRGEVIRIKRRGIERGFKGKKEERKCTEEKGK